jgi:hypothetical protein
MKTMAKQQKACNDLFNLHCKEEFSDIKEGIGELKKILMGNGKPGIKSDVEWCVDKIKGMLWAGAIIITPVLGVLGYELVRMIANHKP